MTGYVSNIEELTLKNGYFRQVLFTAPHSQLVLMCLKPGEEIGAEVHDNVDQFFRIEQGEGKVVFGEAEEYPIKNGSAIVVPAGTKHNLINVSLTAELKLYTIYSPANHPEGTVHQTKADALRAEEAKPKSL